ncbi:carbohydrate ABC transporter substrate-binding protein (CUT1 family) [Salana multivorans]|uniref:Carbohydrate ABC transporter substrate-binding protein (CUT1 family) n=1 Tax=Salana multivorans TaxID=120377 RepID=A0A3N2D0E8_9MICO|nr:extracellular solute-binding protein [Salana multivorans]MBN8882661.1 extracellular solute-binding protein [Salana multivorans]OJX94652.1 MAG: hypothetical protein BGO96_00775 [Micrococcales bacterium 73-15]ROR93260.1 carbohydrate ABC transporter substrate-binding protein (CUT1 family) [Salana multivorans]
MRKSFISAAAIASAALLLAACGGNSGGGTDASETPTADDTASAEETPAEGGEESSAPAVRDPNADLVIWADAVRSEAVQKVADAYGAANDITVTVQTIVDVRKDFVTANQAGNGPDIIVGAHDWLGQLVANGAVEPLQVAGLDGYNEKAVAAATYNGQLYAVPYGMESLVLYCNNETAPGAPFDTIDAAIAAAQGSGATLDTPLVLQTSDAYHMQPLYSSAGGYIFGYNDGVWDVSDLGFASEAGVAAAEKIATLGEAGSGVLKTSIDGTNAASIFLDGKAGCFVSGPWNYNDISSTFGDDGFTMQPVPGFEGMNPATPFLGVNQFYVASNGKNKAYAQDFVTSTAPGGLNTAEAQQVLFDELAQPPAMNEIADKAGAESPSMAIFIAAAQAAQPMPAVPAMDAVWSPAGQAWNSIIGGADVKETMAAAAKAMEEAIAAS